jgi:hypothetical protein
MGGSSLTRSATRCYSLWSSARAEVDGTVVATDGTVFAADGSEFPSNGCWTGVYLKSTTATGAQITSNTVDHPSLPPLPLTGRQR